MVHCRSEVVYLVYLEVRWCIEVAGRAQLALHDQTPQDLKDRSAVEIVLEL